MDINNGDWKWSFTMYIKNGHQKWSSKMVIRNGDYKWALTMYMNNGERKWSLKIQHKQLREKMVMSKVDCRCRLERPAPNVKFLIFLSPFVVWSSLLLLLVQNVWFDL